MKLWCYGVDHGKWGQQLCEIANRNGLSAQVFTEPLDEMKAGDYAFMRIPQDHRLAVYGKEHAKELFHRGLNLIPDLFSIACYEDKFMQVQAHSPFMPETKLLLPTDTVRDAQRATESLGFPFVSKSKEGSSSINVRLVHDMTEALTEYNLAMLGGGIHLPGGKVQKDYLIWQKFCRKNPGDYRVCINGNYLLMLQRDNAHGRPFASGSGKNRPVNNPDEFQTGALKKARQFFEEYDLKWCGIDLVYDYDASSWRVLETTLGWSLGAYEDCVYFGTDYKGKHIWELLVEQIKQGVFA